MKLWFGLRLGSFVPVVCERRRSGRQRNGYGHQTRKHTYPFLDTRKASGLNFEYSRMRTGKETSPRLIKLNASHAVNRSIAIAAMMALGVLFSSGTKADDDQQEPKAEVKMDSEDPLLRQGMPDSSAAVQQEPEAAPPESSGDQQAQTPVATPPAAEENAMTVPMSAPESAPTADASTPGGDNNQDLPDINATTLNLRPLKASTSKHVYLFESQSESESTSVAPPERKLLMIKKGDENVMGLRVLKSLPERNEVIAKRIMKYPPYDELTIGESYVAVEKVSDHAPPAQTAQDKADIAEVESTPLPYDPDLDAGSSPDPNAEDMTNPEDAEAKLGMSIEEKTVKFEHQKNWLSLGIAMLKNSPGPDVGSSYYVGGGLRYGYTLTDNIFTKSGGDKQDSLQVELGAFYYKIVGIDTSNDDYTVLPIVLTGRYNYFLSEDFALFVYGGLEKPFVVASDNSSLRACQTSKWSIPLSGSARFTESALNGPSVPTRVLIC